LLFLKSLLKTAVNSICLGTCLILFSTYHDSHCVSLEAGAKLQLLFQCDKKNLKFFLKKIFISFTSFSYQYGNELGLFSGVQN
ncbi:hypothetical protein, partial [Flavobacterium muglaense]|uniref:hypothetical protein n=1 Tax=Flavobacterium muglaense TaxID=2764716 RepID=UPI001C9AF01C